MKVTEHWSTYYMANGYFLQRGDGVYLVNLVRVFPAVWNFYFTGRLTHPAGA